MPLEFLKIEGISPFHIRRNRNLPRNKDFFLFSDQHALISQTSEFDPDNQSFRSHNWVRGKTDS